MQSLRKLFLFLQNLLIFRQSVSSSEDLQSEILKFLSNLALTLLPLLYFMLFYRLLRSAVSGLFCDLPLEFLESTADIVAFGLFLVEFVLKLEWHFIVAILCFLQLDSCLVHLCQNVEILVLIHRSLVGLVDEDVIFVSNLFNFGLHHPIVIEQAVVCVFSLADGKLQFFFDFLLTYRMVTFEVMFYFISWSFASSSSSSASTSSSSCTFY